MAARIFTVLIFIHQFFGLYCFDYRNVNLWRNEFRECGGNRQSPINIDFRFNRKFLPKSLTFKNYNVIPTEMTLTNDGHSAKFVGKWPAGRIPNVSGGPLSAPYLFDHLHFHWSQSNSRGSEHTFNGRRFALELHLVHYKSSYGSVQNALRRADGLAVIGVIYQFVTHDDSELAPVVRNLTQVRENGSTVRISPFPLSIFKLNKEKLFITYQGSLTTPPCSQIVTWLLAGNLHRITKNQIEAFRQLELQAGDKENFRPAQPLNRRPYRFVRLSD